MYLKEKYINPFTDFGFKKLFGSEPNKGLLIDFLNQILPEYHQIKDLTYNKNELFSASEQDRKAIFDLYCTSENGDKFIVEMQKAKQKFFKDRSIFYSTFPIQEQAQKGTWNFQLTAVYLVGILDFIFDEDSIDNDVRHIVKLKDQHCRVFYDKLTFIYLEMPKFNKSEAELSSSFDKWLYVLKHLPEFESRPLKLQERVFEEVFKVAEIAKFTKVEREQYEASLKYYRDLENVIDTSFQEGKLVREKEIVSNALRSGMSVEVIMQVTGLTAAEINIIAHQSNNE
jgi:predicted transposase/invertase (TIGR01784 family)